MKMYFSSSYILMLGLRWMCMHLWMNWIKRTIDIQEKLKLLKIYVQSQWRVVLMWYHIFWQSSTQRGRHTQLCILTSLKWIIQISVLKLLLLGCKIAFYSPNCLGKLPLSDILIETALMWKLFVFLPIYWLIWTSLYISNIKVQQC